MKQSCLTDELYWDKQYENSGYGNVHRINPTSNLSVKELDVLFRTYLDVNKKKDFLEVGCAPGIWMDYFHRVFQYSVEGIEYTKNGYDITTINLKKFGIDGEVYHQDFFNHTITKKYDVVFSGGFVEHFSNAGEAIQKHIELLNSNGIAIIEIPNLNNWNGYFQRILNKEIYDKHNVDIMNLEYFQKIKDILPVECLYIGYVGKINLSLFQGRLFINLLLLFAQKFLTALYFLGFKKYMKDSEKWSPFIVAIYRKLP